MSTYEPRGAAVELLTARDPFVIASGPAGTGKSLAMLWKAHLTSLLVPDCMSLILRQTHASLTASTLVTFEQQVAAQELASGEVKWFGGSGRKPPAYEYKNGSRIIVGGLDQPGKFLSMDVSRIYIDEATQVSIAAVETLMTRLRGRADTYRQIIAATNPDHPDHHLKKRADAGEARMIESLHQDNPYLVNKDGTLTDVGRDYLARLDALTGVRRARYRDGVWAAAEGLIYEEEWRESANVVDWFPVPAEWPLVMGIDWGYSNPMSVGWWRIDPDGRMYLTREIHESRVLVEDMAKRVKEIMAEHPEEPAPIAVVADHDAEDRKTFERHSGLVTTPAKKAVTRGLQLTQARMRPAGDGKPRLFVVKGAMTGNDAVIEQQGKPRGVAAEILGYVWQTVRGSDGVPTEVPVKANDHAMDMMRYCVMYLDSDLPSKAGNPAAPSEAAQPGRGVAGGILSRPVGR